MLRLWSFMYYTGAIALDHARLAFLDVQRNDESELTADVFLRAVGTPKPLSSP